MKFPEATKLILKLAHAKFVKDMENVLAKVSQSKGLVDEQGNPVGSEPLTMDSEGRVVVLTSGETIEE